MILNPCQVDVAMQEQDREAARTTLFETFAQFGDAFKDVPDEELEREIANTQAEVRAEMRAEQGARSEG